MPATSPFTVVIDTREQQPYYFKWVRADSDEGIGFIEIPIREKALWAGDYSIEGYETRVCVERKTPEDLWGTFTKGRKRFVAELDRLKTYEAAWVVVESELSTLLGGVAHATQFNPKVVTRSVMFWQLRYPSLHWWACPGRATAEAITYQLLRTWWRENVEAPAKADRRREREAKRSATTRRPDRTP